MGSMSIRIDDEIKQRWEKLAAEKGLNASHHIREAIIDKLEELEDFYIVKERLSEPFETISNDEVWKRLGHTD